MYAPDDLASVLPTRVGDVDVHVAWEGSDLSSLDSREGKWWQALATRVGKDAADIRLAIGTGVPPGGLGPDGLPLVIWAIRIEGVPASTWAESYWDIHLKAPLGDGVADEYVWGWRDIDGREVFAALWTPEAMADLRALDPSIQLPDDTGHWGYPVGEVLFWVGIPFDWPVPTPTIEDVLAELP